MAYNNIFSIFNGNSYYTSFSDITNPAYHNFNQPSVPDWFFPNQYNPCPQSNNYNFQNDFNSSQSQWSFTSPSPIFKQLVLLLHLVHNISKIILSSTSSNRKPLILEMSMCESKQQSQIWRTHNFITNSKIKLHLFKSNRKKPMNQSTMKSCLKSWLRLKSLIIMT